MKTNFQKLLEILKKEFKKKEVRKKYLIITGVLIFFNFLVIGLYVSYSYYYTNYSLSLIKATIGDLYLSKYDYIMSVYLENSNIDGIKQYHLSNEIPSFGYVYSGYKCSNNSVLIYNEETKTASVTIDKKENCNIYFDSLNESDLSAIIMIEDNIDSDNYIQNDYIPSYGYKYSHYECDNNSTIEYDNNYHKIKVITMNKDYCKVYFNKEKPDVLINIFVEDEYNTGLYSEKKYIPENTLYVLNSEKSICINNNDERLNNDITYQNGYISIETNNVSSCDIYLDIANE